MSKLNKEINSKEKWYVIRGDRSGAFFGQIKERNPSDAKNIVFKNIRRLWYWDGAASISQIAESGVSKPKNCKFTVIVDELELTDVIELITCTSEAVKNIQEVDVWKM